MNTPLFILSIIFLSVTACKQSHRENQMRYAGVHSGGDSLQKSEVYDLAGKGALLLTKFKSYDELQAVIQIEYSNDNTGADHALFQRSEVRLTHSSGGRQVTSKLTTGVSQSDMSNAQKGGYWDRVLLVLNSPYILFNSNDMRRVNALARRTGAVFGEGDAAFYDLAEMMSNNISSYDSANMPSIDLSEKGYINTFNHINAQALTTSIFSETLADYIADAHERYNMSELITGEFTEAQLTDIENGPTDNYVDMINNEWGQELGKQLKKRYNISRKTKWTPELLEHYLNDMQSYYSWAFQIGFEPVRCTDDVLIRFSNKINRVMQDISKLQRPPP